MGKHFSNILKGLALVCLGAIIAIVGINYIKQLPTFDMRKAIATRVLGESTFQNLTESGQSGVKEIIQDTIDSSKVALASKAGEIEKSALTSLQNEAVSLTNSQLTALKLQICKDWGVITPSPVLTPTN